jgi:hypothetical protein
MKPLVALAALILSACAADGIVYELPSSRAFTASVPVRLVPFDPMRLDPYKQGKHNEFIRTGSRWTVVFSDDARIAETFSITSARLEDDGLVGNYLATYFVEGDLSCGGNIYPIKALGRRSASLQIDKARSDAIERAILSVAMSIEKHLAQCQLTVQPEPREVDMYDELIKLKQLRDEGILTEAEFEAQKEKLLQPE